MEYKTTEYSFEREDGYYFPDVTICNLNGISSSSFVQSIKNNLALKCFSGHENLKNKTEECDTLKRGD